MMDEPDTIDIETNDRGEVIAKRLHFGNLRVFCDSFFGVYAFNGDTRESSPCETLDEAMETIKRWRLA